MKICSNIPKGLSKIKDLPYDFVDVLADEESDTVLLKATDGRIAVCVVGKGVEESGKKKLNLKGDTKSVNTLEIDNDRCVINKDILVEECTELTGFASERMPSFTKVDFDDHDVQVMVSVKLLQKVLDCFSSCDRILIKLKNDDSFPIKFVGDNGSFSVVAYLMPIKFDEEDEIEITFSKTVADVMRAIEEKVDGEEEE